MAVANWTPNSWRSQQGLQMPEYRNGAALAAAEQQLGSYPPLVFAGESRNLLADLAQVQRGEAFLLQGGNATVAMKGIYTPASYTMTMDVTSAGMGGPQAQDMKMHMKMKTSSKRVGECPASTTP